jgi:hypothetical protein
VKILLLTMIDTVPHYDWYGTPLWLIRYPTMIDTVP